VSVVVTEIDRVAAQVVEGFQGLGVATVHDAQGRKGLLASCIRPVDPASRIAGCAVTCEVPPGDNWMVHVAVEQCRPGDILVVAPTSPCLDAYAGDLIATSLLVRGVKGLIIEGGVRDVTALVQMGFPTWSKAISAQATVKETLGRVNCSIVCAGQVIHPGDLIVADADGVVVVPRHEAPSVLAKAIERQERESAVHARLKGGELGLDIYAMRERLAAKGLKYVKYHEVQ
jgi:4-hydroxy-4-methyl-2-oxoglutarate aldolase